MTLQNTTPVLLFLAAVLLNSLVHAHSHEHAQSQAHNQSQDQTQNQSQDHTQNQAQDQTPAQDETDWDVNQPDFSSPAQEVTLDVTEGTWMSLDVAPDGKSVVFDLLGDIYQVPISGGDAQPITSGHAWDIQPRFSPDGAYIAFTSDRSGGDNIWTMHLETSAMHQVTYEDFRLLNNPTWSPDGKYIAARKHFTTSRSLGTGEIWLYHVNGSAEQQGQQVLAKPTDSFQKEQGEPIFAPDGSGIYFSINSTAGDEFIYHQDSNREIFQIRRVDLKDGKVTRIAGGPGGAVRPTPSPDGKKLAYVKRLRAQSRLFVMDLESNEETMLFDALDPDMQETWAVHGVYPNLDWTPDSKHIVFWAQGKLWKLAVANRKLSEIPFRVQDTRSVYPALRFPVAVAPDTFNTRMVRFAQHSPDGKAIVFESLGSLYLKRGNRQPQRLTDDKPRDGFDYYPVWAPNSDRVYFLRWHDRQLSSIRTVEVSGGRSRVLSLDKGQYTELAISGDGKRLAYRKRPGNSLLNPDWDVKSGLYVLDLDTGKSQFVRQRGTHPHFGADARLYAQERSTSPARRGSDTAKTQLISMTLAGHDVRTLAQADFATAIRLAPGGQHIAFIDKYQIYLTLAMPSGKVITLDAAKPAFPTVQLSNIGGTYLYWSADGTAVSWSVGPELTTVRLDDALEPDYPGPDLAGTRVDLSMAVKADQPQTKLALTNVRILTMNVKRDVIEQGRILIEGNRIRAVGTSQQVPIPPGYLALDMSGKTVLPGLVDIHAHGPYGSGEIIPQQNWNLLAHLALGVTTIHDPSSRANLAFAAAEYAKAGLILSPRIFSTAEIVYGAKSTYWAPVDGLDDALAHVRRLKAQGAISVKNYNQPRRNQRQQVNEAARREGMMSVAEGGSLYHMDMNMIADGITGIEHNVPTLKMYDDVTQFWRQSGAGYTPTLVVTYGGLTAEDYYYQKSEVWKHPILANFVPPAVLQPRAVRRIMAPEADFRDDDAARAAKVLLDAGVLVNTGAHGQREGLATHWEMWSFSRGGFSPMQALAAATINPATYLGLEQDLGSLESGKLADMVVLYANPLDDIQHSDNISYVLQGGRVYVATSLEEQHTGSRQVLPFYWQGKAHNEIR